MISCVFGPIIIPLPPNFNIFGVPGPLGRLVRLKINAGEGR